MLLPLVLAVDVKILDCRLSRLTMFLFMCDTDLLLYAAALYYIQTFFFLLPLFRATPIILKASDFHSLLLRLSSVGNGPTCYVGYCFRLLCSNL